MNNSTNSHDNNTEEDDSRLLIILTLSTVPALLAFILNVTFVVVGIQSLNKKFHNLLVLFLCFNNGFRSFAVAFVTTLNLAHMLRGGIMLCTVSMVTVVYGIMTSYFIIFLLGFARFVTIRYQKFNFVNKLERFKYPIFLILHLTSLLLVIIVIVSLADATAIESCSGASLFGKNYRIFILAEWLPITVLILLIIIMYTICSYDLWKQFLQKKVNNRSHVYVIELELRMPRNSNKIVPSTSIEDDLTQDDTSTSSNYKYNHTRPYFLSEFKESDVSSENDIEDFDQSIPREENIGDIGRTRSVSKTKKTETWEVRAFKTNLLVAATNVCLTSPFAMSFIYDLFAQEDMSDKIRYGVYALTFVNHFLDPFVYAFRVPEIRNEIRKKFKRQRLT